MTFATNMSLEHSSRRSQLAPEHGHASATAYPAVSPLHSRVVRRKASCACGGGCPRCSEQRALQPKLRINMPGDLFEREADRMAEAVINGGSTGVDHAHSPVGVQRSCACGGAAGAGTCATCQEEEKEESLQMSAENSSAGAHEFAPAIVQEVLRSSGQPLDPATRAFFEPRFGRDFGDVRVHADARATESARAIHELAYTVGREVVFESGQFGPGTAAGDRLLAHEFTHVIQQSDHRAERLQRQVSPASSPLPSPRFSPSAKLERCFEDTDRLGQGDPDTDPVTRIQQALIDVQQITGNTYDLGSTGPNNDGVDGDYGPKTAAAVRKFKADEKLGFTQFGDVGPGVMHRLDELFPAGPT